MSQALAWHSADSAEREAIRAEIRAACRRRLAADPHASVVSVVELGGAVLERVERDP